MKVQLTVVICVLNACLMSLAQDSQLSAPPPSSTATSVRLYDASADAAADIQSAITRARQSGKRILLEIGGDWCPWCHHLHRCFREHPDLLNTRDENFITVPVNFSPENKNEAVLARYGNVPSIPYFLVLDSDGNLIHRQFVSDFVSKDGYSSEQLKAFFLEWSGPLQKLTGMR